MQVIEKPWGHEEIWGDLRNKYLGKTLHINMKNRLSLQYHEKKEETFLILYGEVHMQLNGEERVCLPGDVINIEAGVRHAFSSPNGSVIEEISSTHFKRLLLSFVS